MMGELRNLILIFASLTAGLSFGEPSDLEIFKKTLYPFFTQKQCTRCHDGQRRESVWGPSFAHTDSEKAYRQVLKYIQFENVSESVLVTKGGGGHWLNDYGVDCKTNPEQIAAVIETWKKERTPFSKDNRIITPPQVLSNEVASAGKYVSLNWDLSSIVGIPGVEFNLEVTQIKTAQSAAYLFRKPRLVSSQTAVEIKAVQLLLNGKAHGWRTPFKAIHAQVAPVMGRAPLLSMETEIVKQELAGEDLLQIEFEVIRKSGQWQIPPIDLFKEKILPFYEVRNCWHCHREGGTVFAFSKEPKELAEQTFSHLVLGRLEQSPWLLLPGKGLHGHPVVFTDEDYPEVLASLKDWVSGK